jgi:hypothetical protein
MSQVVQAKCPHCQNVLRIPSEWVDRAMRCKFCKQTFQAKAKQSGSVNIASGAPKSSGTIPIGKPAGPRPGIPVGLPASAAGAPPSGGAPFGFEQADSPATPSIARRRSRGNGLLLLVVMFFFLFVLGAGGAGFLVYKAINTGPKQLTKADPFKNDNSTTPQDDAKKKNVEKEDPKKDPEPKEEPKNQDPPKKDPPKKEVLKKNPKKEPPKKDPEKKDPEKKDPEIVKKTPPKGPEVFPRRALLISVNNYLYYNTVHYGSELNAFYNGYPGSSTGVLRDRLTRPPMNFPANQVYELSDGIPAGKAIKPHSTQRSVIETTIKDFLDGSRAQDRVVVFFAGHAASVKDKSYLVPVDGDLKNVDSLVPLSWVYDQLAGCKAQQKILILDTFRYSPARGSDLGVTGDGEFGTLPEAFDKDLASPPAGVQVWAACSKHEAKTEDGKKEFVFQNSIELEGGSAFLQALCNALQGGGAMKGISSPQQPIPIDALVKDVNERLKALAEAEKRTQISQLSGRALDGVVAYNKDEALPDVLVIRPPTTQAGADLATAAQMKGILDFFSGLPAVRESRAGDQNVLSRFPPFKKSKLENYKSDSDKEFQDLFNQYKSDKAGYSKEFPLRAAVFDAIESMQDSSKLRVREVLFKADSDPKRKAAFLLEQEPIGVSIFKLEGSHRRFLKAGEQRDMETSRRWQAHYDYTQARLQSRLVYLIEYSYTLAAIRRDDLPELAMGQTGWRLGTGKRISVSEKKAKDLVKDNKGIWARIIDQYPETPWSVLAAREKEIPLGLEWRPKSD